MSEKNFHPELTKNFPAEVKQIFEVFLQKNPDSIRLVGGCVRDMLIDITHLKDYDFATVFLPDQTLEILQENNIHAVPTGLKFGTITAVINKKHFEITTLRKDSETDGRHCEPEFIDDYYLDAARRDFTINALYLDEKGVIYDYFDGLKDLKNSCVKFIGNADERINEDFLRILRFFRFSCRYSANLDYEGLNACIKNKKGIKNLSADRIRNEIFKILENKSAQKLLWIFNEIEKSEIRNEIFSAQFQIENLQKLLQLSQNLKIEFNENLKFAALIFAPEINFSEIFSRLNFSNSDKEYFEFLAQENLSLDFKSLRKALVFAKKDFVRDLFFLKIAIYANDNLVFDEIEELLNYINEFTLPVFPVNGNDLLSLGVNGKKIGELLLEMKLNWIESDFQLTKNELLKNFA